MSLTMFESGNAFTVYNGISSARDFEPDMPNVSGNANLSRGERSFYRWFNTDAFTAPPQDVKGTAGGHQQLGCVAVKNLPAGRTHENRIPG